MDQCNPHLCRGKPGLSGRSRGRPKARASSRRIGFVRPWHPAQVSIKHQALVVKGLTESLKVLEACSLRIDVNGLVMSLPC